jgi:hypothetical protein
MDAIGQTSFARVGPNNSQEHKYYTSPSPYYSHPHHLAHGYPGFGHFFPHSPPESASLAQSQNTSSSGQPLAFDDMFYHRSCNEAEWKNMITNEQGRLEAEKVSDIKLIDFLSNRKYLSM